MGQFSTRIAAFCEDIVNHHPGESVIFFTHAGTIDGVLRWALGLPASSPWQHEFELPNGSITKLVFWPRGRIEGGSPRYAVLERVGDARHLNGFISDL